MSFFHFVHRVETESILLVATMNSLFLLFLVCLGINGFVYIHWFTLGGQLNWAGWGFITFPPNN